MNVFEDIPLSLRIEQGNLARKIKRIGNKVHSQALLRHPEDHEHLTQMLVETAEELEALMEKIRELHR